MRLSRRPWKFLLPVVVLFFFAFTLSRTTRRAPPDPTRTFKAKTRSYFPPLKNPTNNKLDIDYCENFPAKQLDDVQVVLKTGTGDREKIRAHLLTVSSCISNILIVSDHDEKIGDYRIIDVLADLPATYADNNSDFQTYVEHKKAHAEGDTANYAQQGWKLDRFKILPMVDKAYEKNPKAKWYVFLESDVYFLWDTLFRLLEQYDPTEPHYLGAPASGSADRAFAYSGAGFVLSQGLMKKLLPQKASGGFSKISHRYEEWVKDDPRGDAVLARAILNSTEVKLESLNPTFSGEDLRTIKIDADRWCTPLLSLHRISPEQMEALWKWERTRSYNTVCTTRMLKTNQLLISISRNHLCTLPSSAIPIPSSVRALPEISGTTSPKPPSRMIDRRTETLAPAAMNATRIPTASSTHTPRPCAVLRTTSSSATPSMKTTADRVNLFQDGI